MSTQSSTTLGNISEVISLYSNSRPDIDSLSLSSHMGTPTSSSSSFRTINTALYRLSDNCPVVYPDFGTTKKHAVLAEAEDITDIDEDVSEVANLTADDLEYMDNENLVDSVEMFTETDKKVNESELIKKSQSKLSKLLDIEANNKG